MGSHSRESLSLHRCHNSQARLMLQQTNGNKPHKTHSKKTLFFWSKLDISSPQMKKGLVRMPPLSTVTFGMGTYHFWAAFIYLAHVYLYTQKATLLLCPPPSFLWSVFFVLFLYGRVGTGP